jgi:transposase
LDKKTFEVEYKEAQVYNILAKIGVSFVKGKGFVESKCV